MEEKSLSPSSKFRFSTEEVEAFGIDGGNFSSKLRDDPVEFEIEGDWVWRNLRFLRSFGEDLAAILFGERERERGRLVFVMRWNEKRKVCLNRREERRRCISIWTVKRIVWRF